ncbi:MAG: four helix bundle protein [Saprospiraceae bacterium]|nr:four helix bundle protein [Saprospiraceae bacterium]
MTSQELNTRFKSWAVAIVGIAREWPTRYEYRMISNQIMRSASSAACNYRSACRRKSNKDFLNKLKIVEEELDESMFWLEFVVALTPSLKKDVVPLFKEANELLSITVASISTIRKTIKSQKRQT